MNELITQDELKDNLIQNNPIVYIQGFHEKHSLSRNNLIFNGYWMLDQLNVSRGDLSRSLLTKLVTNLLNTYNYYVNIAEGNNRLIMRVEVI